MTPEPRRTPCAGLRSQNASQNAKKAKCRRPGEHPDQSTGSSTYRKNPSVWTRCLGNKANAHANRESIATKKKDRKVSPMQQNMGTGGCAHVLRLAKFRLWCSWKKLWNSWPAWSSTTFPLHGSLSINSNLGYWNLASARSFLYDFVSVLEHLPKKKSACINEKKENTRVIKTCNQISSRKCHTDFKSKMLVVYRRA